MCTCGDWFGGSGWSSFGWFYFPSSGHSWLLLFSDLKLLLQFLMAAAITSLFFLFPEHHSSFCLLLDKIFSCTVAIPKCYRCFFCYRVS